MVTSLKQLALLVVCLKGSERITCSYTQPRYRFKWQLPSPHSYTEQNLGSKHKTDNATQIMTPMVPMHYHVHQMDDFSNEEMLKKTSISSVASASILLQLQLSWAGHMVSMEETHLSKVLLFGKLLLRKCNYNAPRRRYKYQLKKLVLFSRNIIKHGNKMWQTTDVCRNQYWNVADILSWKEVK